MHKPSTRNGAIVAHIYHCYSASCQTLSSYFVYDEKSGNKHPLNRNKGNRIPYYKVVVLQYIAKTQLIEKVSPHNSVILQQSQWTF